MQLVKTGREAGGKGEKKATLTVSMWDANRLAVLREARPGYLQQREVEYQGLWPHGRTNTAAAATAGPLLKIWLSLYKETQVEDSDEMKGKKGGWKATLSTAESLRPLLDFLK